jgi:hypothetical protein
MFPTFKNIMSLTLCPTDAPNRERSSQTNAKKKNKNVPFDVFLLGEEAFKDALLAEEVALVAGEGLDEGLEADTAGVEWLDGVFPEAFSLGTIAELPLLIVSEESEIVVVLGMPLRHDCPREASRPSLWLPSLAGSALRSAGFLSSFSLFRSLARSADFLCSFPLFFLLRLR